MIRTDNVVSKWWFVRRQWKQSLGGCVVAMLLHPIAFPRIFMARLRYFRNRSFTPLESMHRFRLRTVAEFLSYWEFFVDRGMNGRWMEIPRNRTFPVVLDVGANRGMFCRLIRSMNEQARVVAFEPNPAMQASLSECVYMDRYAVALSNCEGSHTMHVAGDCAHMDSEFGRDFTSTIKVQKKTLDSFGYRMVDVLKIDVDGHLIEVLQGAKETIRGTKCMVLEICFDHEMEQVLETLEDKWKIEKLDCINYAFTRP